MLKGENIICFAKDWSEDPTSNNHVMRLLSRDNRVLWLNSIAMRTPQISSGRDFKKIVKKLASVSDGARQVDTNLWVYTPLVVPVPFNQLAVLANRQILRASVALLRRALKMQRFQLWTFLPTSAPYVKSLGAYLNIYYCTDEFSRLYADGEHIQQMEDELLRSVDLVFTTAGSLWEKKRALNSECYLAPHGVAHAHFAAALQPDLAIPEDVASLPRPMIGFFGLLQDWIDQDLLCHLAERHPEWSIVLIGPVQTDTTRLQRFSNIHLLGRRPFKSLPAYCKAFSAGMIPFALNELTIHVNPIKLLEYMAAGLPVVSTPLPEVIRYKDQASVAQTREEFVTACEREVAADSPARREERSRAMARESWESRVEQIGDRVLQAKARLGC